MSDARWPVNLHDPIPAPDYTMRAGFSHEKLPDRNTRHAVSRETLEARLAAMLEVVEKWESETMDMDPANDGYISAMENCAYEAREALEALT